MALRTAQRGGVVLLLGLMCASIAAAQTDRDPLHQPVTAAEIERLKRQITRDSRSNLEVISGLHTESGDFDNRLDFRRYGGRLNLKFGSGSTLSASLVRTNYLPRIDAFDAQSTSVTVGLTTALSDSTVAQFELGTIWFSSDASTVTAMGTVNFDVSERTTVHIGGSRTNVEESLLSATGLHPSRGPFAGRLAGRVMDNRVIVGMTHRLPYQTDVFGEGAFGNREGNSIDSNAFRDAHGGAGINLIAASDGPVTLLRASYHCTYFGFGANRLGFGGVSMQNRRGDPISPTVLGSDGLSPFPSATRPGIGGYFSPGYFVSNVGRLDVHGVVHPDIAYRLGGFIGIQRYAGAPNRPVTGLSATAEFVLSKRYSVPISFHTDNSGPFRQQSTLANLRIAF
jgi:cellulose synthase operon protein C